MFYNHYVYGNGQNNSGNYFAFFGNYYHLGWGGNDRFSVHSLVGQNKIDSAGGGWKNLYAGNGAGANVLQYNASNWGRNDLSRSHDVKMKAVMALGGWNTFVSKDAVKTTIEGWATFGGNKAIVHNGTAKIHLETVGGANIAHHRVWHSWETHTVRSDHYLGNLYGSNESYVKLNGSSTAKLVNGAGVNKAHRDGWAGWTEHNLIQKYGYNESIVRVNEGNSYQTLTNIFGANYAARSGNSSQGSYVSKHVLSNFAGVNTSDMSMSWGLSEQHLQTALGYNKAYRWGGGDAKQSLISLAGANHAFVDRNGWHDGSVTQILVTGVGHNKASATLSYSETFATQVLANLGGYNEAYISGGQGATQVAFNLIGGNSIVVKGNVGSVTQVGVALLVGANNLVQDRLGKYSQNDVTVQYAFALAGANVFWSADSYNGHSTVVQVGVNLLGANVMTARNKGTTVQVAVSVVGVNTMISEGDGDKVQVGLTLHGANVAIANSQDTVVQVGIAAWGGVNVAINKNGGDNVQVAFNVLFGANVSINQGAGTNVQVSLINTGVNAHIATNVSTGANVQAGLALAGLNANVATGDHVPVNVGVGLVGVGGAANVLVADADVNVQFSLALIGVAVNAMIGDAGVNVMLAGSGVGAAGNVHVGDADVSVMAAILPPHDFGSGGAGAGVAANVSIGDTGVLVMFAMAARGVSANVSIGDQHVAVSLAFIYQGANALVNVGSTDVNVMVGVAYQGANVAVAVGVEWTNVMVLGAWQGVNVAVVVGDDLGVNVMLAAGKHAVNVLTAIDAAINVMVGGGKTAINIFTNVDFEQQGADHTAQPQSLRKSGAIITIDAQSSASALEDKANAELLDGWLTDQDRDRISARADYGAEAQTIDAEGIISNLRSASAERAIDSSAQVSANSASKNSDAEADKTLANLANVAEETLLPALQEALFGKFSEISEGATNGNAAQVAEGVFTAPIQNAGTNIGNAAQNLDPTARINQIEGVGEQVTNSVETVQSVFEGSSADLIHNMTQTEGATFGGGQSGSSLDALDEAISAQRHSDMMKLALGAASGDAGADLTGQIADVSMGADSGEQATGHQGHVHTLLQQDALDQKLIGNANATNSLSAIRNLMQSEALDFEDLLDEAQASQADISDTNADLHSIKTKAQRANTNLDGRSADKNASNSYARYNREQELAARDHANSAEEKRDAILAAVDPLRLNGSRAAVTADTGHMGTALVDDYPGARVNVMAGLSVDNGANVMTNVAAHGVNVMIASTALSSANLGAFGESEQPDVDLGQDAGDIRDEISLNASSPFGGSDAAGGGQTTKVGLNILTNVHTAREDYSDKDVNVMAVVNGGMSLNILTGVTDGLQVQLALNLGDAISVMTAVGTGTHVQTAVTFGTGINAGISVGKGDTVQVLAVFGKGLNAAVKVDPNLGDTSHTVVQIGVANLVLFKKYVTQSEGTSSQGQAVNDISGTQARVGGIQSGLEQLNPVADVAAVNNPLEAGGSSKNISARSQGQNFEAGIAQSLNGSVTEAVNGTFVNGADKLSAKSSGVDVGMQTGAQIPGAQPDASTNSAAGKTNEITLHGAQNAIDKFIDNLKQIITQPGINLFSSVSRGTVVQLGLGVVNAAVNIRDLDTVALNGNGAAVEARDANVTVQVMIAENINVIYNHGFMQTYSVSIGAAYAKEDGLNALKYAVHNFIDGFKNIATSLGEIAKAIGPISGPNGFDFELLGQNSTLGIFHKSDWARGHADNNLETSKKHTQAGINAETDEDRIVANDAAADAHENAVKGYKEAFGSQFNSATDFFQKVLNISGQFLNRVFGNIGESNWIVSGYGSSINIAANRQNLVFSDGVADVRDFSIGAIFGTQNVLGNSIFTLADVLGFVREQVPGYSVNDFATNGSTGMSTSGAVFHDIVSHLANNEVQAWILKPNSLTLARLAPNITDIFGENLAQKETMNTVASIWDEGRFGTYVLDNIEIIVKTPTILTSILRILGYGSEAISELFGINEGNGSTTLYFNPEEFAPDGYVQNYISPVEHLARSLGMESTNFSLGTVWGDNVQSGGSDAALSWASAHMTDGVFSGISSMMGDLLDAPDPFALLERLPQRLGDLFDNQFGEFEFKIGDARSDDINFVTGDSNTVFSGAGNDINLLAATPLRQIDGQNWEYSRGNLLISGAGHDINILSGQSNMVYAGVGNDFIYSIGDRLLARGEAGNDFVVASVNSGGTITTQGGNDIVFAVQNYQKKEIIDGVERDVQAFSPIHVAMGGGDDIAVVVSNKSLLYETGRGTDMAILLAADSITISLTSGQSFIAAYAPTIHVRYLGSLLQLTEGQFEGGLFTLSGADDIGHIPKHGHGGIYIGDEADNTFVVAAKNTTLIGGAGADAFYFRSNLISTAAKVQATGEEAGYYDRDENGDLQYGYVGSSTAIRDFILGEDSLVFERDTALKFIKLSDSNGLLILMAGTDDMDNFTPGTKSFAVIDGYFNASNDAARANATGIHLTNEQFSDYDAVQSDMANWQAPNQTLDLKDAFFTTNPISTNSDQFEFTPTGTAINFNDLVKSQDADGNAYRFADLIKDGALSDTADDFFDQPADWLLV